MRKLLLVLWVFVAGCAAQVTTMNVPNIERSSSVQVQDLRPETEKEGEIFSLSISNDAYAIYRIADSALTPPATRLLQHRAFEKMGNSIGGPLGIKIHHFVIYRNRQAELKRGAIFAAFGGAVGAALAGETANSLNGVSSSLLDGKVFESLAATEYKRALYTEQENPGRGSVYIVYIEAEIQGKRVFTRTVAPFKEGEDSLTVALEESTKFYLSHYQ